MKEGVEIVTSLECGGLANIPDLDPQWIRIPTLNTKQLLSKFYVLLVCWLAAVALQWGDHPVQKLFRFISKKFDPLLYKSE